MRTETTVKKGASEASTYLYSNKNLYHSVLEEFNKGNCLFSRNLLANLENTSNQPGPFYGKHLKECTVCQVKVQRYKKLLTSIKTHIPYQQPGNEFIDHIGPEVKEAFNLYKKKLSNQNKSKLFFKGELASQMGKDFLYGVLLTPALIKAILWSGIGALVIHLIA